MVSRVRQQILSLLQSGVLPALVVLLMAFRAEALTLGDLVVQSTPGEPVEAFIPVFLEQEESLADLWVTLASEEDYAAQQLERPPLVQGMKIALLARGEGQGRIKLFGEQAWPGDAAVLLLHLQWPQGELSRRFRIEPVVSETERTTPLYVEVAENESLDTIAMRLSKRSNRSYLHMMVALYRANPEAFYRDNLNNLKGGARLRVPSSEELYSLSDAEVFATLREHEQRWKTAQQQAKQAAREQEKAAQIKQQLEQVTRESEAMAERNRLLKERLARLEQQMASMSQRVLEYPSPEPEAAEEAPKPLPSSSAEAAAPDMSKDEGLSVPVMLLLMALVVVAVAAIWRFAPQRAGGG